MNLEKLKEYFGLNDEELNPKVPAKKLTGTKQGDRTKLEAEVHELKSIIKKQNTLLQELSDDNMQLGRDLQRLLDLTSTQQQLISVYEDIA